MKKLTLVLLVLFSMSCSQTQVDLAQNILDQIPIQNIIACGQEDVFSISTASAYSNGPGSPMGYNGDSGQPLWWYGYLMEGCNLKFLEFESTWGDALPYLSRCEPHEISNIATYICNKIPLGFGMAEYWRGQGYEYFDGKTHANAICGCHKAAILPDDFGEIGDPLYMKINPIE